MEKINIGDTVSWDENGTWFECVVVDIVYFDNDESLYVLKEEYMNDSYGVLSKKELLEMRDGYGLQIHHKENDNKRVSARYKLGQMVLYKSGNDYFQGMIIKREYYNGAIIYTIKNSLSDRPVAKEEDIIPIRIDDYYPVGIFTSGKITIIDDSIIGPVSKEDLLELHGGTVLYHDDKKVEISMCTGRVPGYKYRCITGITFENGRPKLEYEEVNGEELTFNPRPLSKNKS